MRMTRRKGRNVKRVGSERGNAPKVIHIPGVLK
jgi:hypothetical protein